MDELNDTQRAIFGLLIKAPYTKRELARELGRSVKTIENNLTAVFRAVRESEEWALYKYTTKDKELKYRIVRESCAVLPQRKRRFTQVQGGNGSLGYSIVTFEDWDWDKTFKLYPIGDIHFGHPSCDTEKLRRFIDYIEQEENAFILLTGDLIENGTRHSLGRSVYEQLISPEVQIEGIVRLFAPVWDRIIGVLSGNHEERTDNLAGFNPARIIAQRLRAAYFPTCAYFDIWVGEHKLELFATHGYGTARFPYTRLKNIMDYNRFIDADVYVIGHFHDLNTLRDCRIVKDAESVRLLLKKRYYVVAGSFLKYFDTYAERRGFYPTGVGAPKIAMYRGGDIHVSI
jgi:predicted phosphodiesterase